MIRLEELKKQIAEIKDINDFFLICNAGVNPAVNNWVFATLPLEQALDTFMQQLAGLDRRTAIQFSAIFAKHAFRYVYENHLDQVREVGFSFLDSDECLDGESIEKQLKNVENWLKDPTQGNLEAVKKGIDPSRQLNVWEEDLFPPDDQMWLWIIENTQLLSMAVLAGVSETHDDDPERSPYGWSDKACVTRSAICSLKSIAKEKREPAEDLTSMFRKVGEEW